MRKARHLDWMILAVCVLAGCGSLSHSALYASARAAYPDCEDVQIGERADGVRQWMVICGERRLFGLRDEAAIARDRRGLPEDERFEILFEDESPALAWSAAARAEDRVTASLRPLQVSLAMLGIDDTSYLLVESPRSERCAARPQIIVGGEPVAIDSARTEADLGSRRQFAQRLDSPTLALLASEPFEVTYCGQRYALDGEAATAFRAWAAERFE